tara:strand:+ start:527 stop:907 length:381 start_codon:yes stop_codon:yes gene_type:complete
MSRSSNPIMHFASAIYNSQVDGVSTGVIELSQTTIIPDNALIVQMVIETLVAPTSLGSATIMIQAGGVNLTSTLVLTNFVTTTPLTTISLRKKKALSSNPIRINVGTADLIAGKLNIILGYFMSGE